MSIFWLLEWRPKLVGRVGAKLVSSNRVNLRGNTLSDNKSEAHDSPIT